MPTSSGAAGGATRGRLVAAMADALQSKGFHAVGIAELLEQASAPKGVLYHHFPGGKTELAVAAVQSAVGLLIRGLDRLLAEHGEPAGVLRAWFALAQQRLEKSGFERGCPLATVALETGPHDEALRQALADGFDEVRRWLAATLTKAGAPPSIARRLALLVVSSYEGALLQARVAGSVKPVADTAAMLVELVREAIAPRDAKPPKRGP
jgi:TetR/AcrR family transcriptional repressor of lmrAB and yxaGH operons